MFVGQQEGQRGYSRLGKEGQDWVTDFPLHVTGNQWMISKQDGSQLGRFLEASLP
jgi:hypothetical protein